MFFSSVLEAAYNSGISHGDWLYEFLTKNESLSLSFFMLLQKHCMICEVLNNDAKLKNYLKGDKSTLLSLLSDRYTNPKVRASLLEHFEEELYIPLDAEEAVFYAIYETSGYRKGRELSKFLSEKIIEELVSTKSKFINALSLLEPSLTYGIPRELQIMGFPILRPEFIMEKFSPFLLRPYFNLLSFSRQYEKEFLLAAAEEISQPVVSFYAKICFESDNELVKAGEEVGVMSGSKSSFFQILRAYYFTKYRDKAEISLFYKSLSESLLSSIEKQTDEVLFTLIPFGQFFSDDLFFSILSKLGPKGHSSLLGSLICNKCLDNLECDPECSVTEVHKLDRESQYRYFKMLEGCVEFMKVMDIDIISEIIGCHQ